MITGYLDEVFVKAVTETGIDMVFIVRNLPKKLIYREVPKMVQRVDRDGYSDGAQVPDPSGEKMEDLLDGLEHSQNDEAILFYVTREPGKFALQAIDRYIAGTLPRDVAIPLRVPYPMQPGDPRSMPKPKHLIPAIDLPKQIDRAESLEISPATQVASSKPVRTLSPEQKAKKAEILKKARAVKAAKKQQKLK